MKCRYWNRLSIKQRLTGSYIFFILLPFSLLAVHSYIQADTFQKEQALGSMMQTLTVVKNRIEGKMNLVESISHNITYNSRLQGFLAEPYDVQNGSLDQYFQNIHPIVYFSLQYNQVEIDNIKVYMNNRSIPEGFGSFYQDIAVQGNSWYDSFMESQEISRWIELPAENSYAYLQKIVSGEGVFLGITSVSVQKQDLLASLDELAVDSPYLFVTDAHGQLQYGGRAGSLAPALLQQLTTSDSFGLNGHLYVVEQLDRLGYRIGMEKDLPHSLGSYQLMTTSSFVAAMVLSLLLFYQVLKKTFVKIKASIRAMDQSIRTGFTELIPVERNDEIGVITEKFNTLLVQIDSLVNDRVIRETMLKDVQLQALQSQINPHFIYNTLNLFSAKTEIAGLYDVSEAFSDFSQILRYNMNGQSEWATMKQEINHVLNYFRLQKLKYSEQLQLSWTCDPQLLQVQIIRFILQPVVENSIAHGMSHPNELQITLDIKLNDMNGIVIVITDNGTGITPSRLDELNQFFLTEQDITQSLPAFNTDGTGIGLRNINNRLRLSYGFGYSMKMESMENRYTRTIFTIPFKRC
ncbi:sensor histidine kinase [Paenibacillus sp. HW567]|uniref:sensor histidine kinase n=1 Tax=Paenibacillus sp. HW567 TaxID=1034769 RepID=UPI00036D996D|nr:histidine kinase [Paenibacillus sp. HW567]